MDVTNVLVNPVVLGGVTAGLVNLVKLFGVEGKWTYLSAIGIGIVLGAPMYLSAVSPTDPVGWVDFYGAILFGLSTGLTSVGMYEGVSMAGEAVVTRRNGGTTEEGG